MADNKLLANLGVAVGDSLSAAMELQTRLGTAVALRIQVVFMDVSDVIVAGGTFDGENIDDVYGDYAASPDTDGPWFRSRLFSMVVPAGSVKINIGFAYDSTTVGTIVSTRKPILNKGFKPAPFSPVADNIPALAVFTPAAVDWIPFDDQGISRKGLISAWPLSLFSNDIPDADFDHDQLANFVDGEHVDWEIASQGGIHITNLPSYADDLSTPSSTTNSLTLDAANGHTFEVTLTENVTTTTVSNLFIGTNRQVISLKLIQDGTGGFTFVFPSGTQWAGGTVPTVTSAANAIDIFRLTTYDNGTSFFGEVVGQNFS